jgi:hypothetical protein
MSEDLKRQLAAEKERADYAWKNTRTIEAARQEEMRKRDAAETENTKLREALRRLYEWGGATDKWDGLIVCKVWEWIEGGMTEPLPELPEHAHPHAKSQAAAPQAQVACTDGLGVAVPPAPTLGETT